jgi:beta-glucanase (GH16 family)
MKNRLLASLIALIVSTLFSFTQAQDINLTGYNLSFDDEFNSLSATTTSPKGATTWYAQPLNSYGYYSSSTWDITAMSTSGGILSDEAFLDANNNWHSGELLSVDPTGAGFSQTYGYFEIRCQMPSSGTGAWPAFWLDTLSSIPAQANEEIDVFEWYGTEFTNNGDLVQETSHNWNADGSQNTTTSPYLPSTSTAIPSGALPWQGYHIYGVLIDPVHVTWYIDGVQTNQCGTPTSYMTTPFFVQLDYALGGGWPLSGMVNNSSFNVDWVRVYSLPSGGSTPASIGMQFQGSGTALASTDSAGLSTVAQSDWNVLTGSSFSSHALTDSTGASTTATISGSANGTYWSGGSTASPAGNAKLASGELFNGWPGQPNLTVSNIPYASYDVYVYAGIDASGRAETMGLTPSGGSAQYYSFTTEAGGSAWTAATSTWNGTGTQPSLPTANYVHYTGLTASSFTLAWGAPGNGGINGIQIVPKTSPPTITTQPTNQSAQVGQTATFSVAATGTPTLTYQWSKNGTAISGATSATYTTPAVTSSDNGATFSVVVTNPYGNATSTTATLTVTSAPSTATIGLQFQGQGTALLSTDSAGLSSVAQTNWNVLTGSSFSSHALVNSTGAATTATISGTAGGYYWSGGSSASPAGNSKLASGELINTWPGGSTLTVASIPYTKYDVYIYAGIDATGRAETMGLTPSGGTEVFSSFTTESGGSAWTAATSTWNGTGTQPSLPSANYVHFTGLTASSFTLAWGAPGNGGMNGIEIVPTQ